MRKPFAAFSAQLPSEHPLRWPAAPSPEEEQAFWREKAEQGVGTWRLLLLGAAVIATLVWWPTDLLFFADSPGAVEAFAKARVFTATSALTVYLLIRYTAFFRKRALMAMSAVALGVAFVMAWQMGTVGGPGEIWFHFTHLLVLTPIAGTLRPAHRIVLTALIVLALGLGLFGMNPQHLRDPLAGATISWLFFLALLGILGGHFADLLRRREFFQRREAQRLTLALRTLKESLEEQVFERTAEVRQLARHVESAREAERTRIARDLHDDLGQELTALRYGVEFARARWTKAPASIGRNLDDVHGLATNAGQSLRTILSDLRPRVLDDLGFNAAAEWLVKRTADRTGLQVVLEQRGEDKPLPETLATSAFRVLQEALSNATRHSGAGRVDVVVDLQLDTLELTIADDGKGFEPAQKTDNRGYGLIGMRERAAFHGGVARVESTAGAGTRVHVRLPLPVEPEVQA